MYKSKLIYVVFLLLGLYSCRENKEGKFRKENTKLLSELEQKTKNIFSENNLKGDFLFAIVDEDGLLYSFALNNDILNGKQSSLSDDTPLYIASHTKSFTGTLLKILEEKGTLNLEASMHNYLPELTFNDSIDTKKIKVKQLLNHTHGTFSTPFTWKTAFLGYSGKNSELINDLNTNYLYDSSHKFRYSNVGPVVAAIISEKVTEESWKETVKKEIFKPLKMNNTSAKVSDYNFDEILPSYTVSKDGKIINKDFYKEDITMHASGGIISTVNDLSKWLSANIRQDTVLLNKVSWTAMHIASTEQNRNYFTYKRNSYSLGWDIAEYQKDTILTRFGGLAGISFHISFIPSRKIGIIAFSNDNRAYTLPHLMANYAYNGLTSLKADSIFTSEKEKFDKSFTKENEIAYPNENNLLKTNESIVGRYASTKGWPAIAIFNKEDYCMFKWGGLEGKIYRKEDGSYQSDLGVLQRNFQIKNDTLKTGSLIYLKN